MEGDQKHTEDQPQEKNYCPPALNREDAFISERAGYKEIYQHQARYLIPLLRSVPQGASCRYN